MGGLPMLVVALVPVVDFTPRVELEAGTAVIVESPIELPTRLPRADATLEAIAPPRGVELFSEVEVERAGRNSRLRWALSAGSREMQVDLQFRVTVRGPRRILRRVRIRQRVHVRPRTRDLAPAVAAAAERLDASDASWTGRVERWSARRELRLASARSDAAGQRAYAALAARAPKDALPIEGLTPAAALAAIEASMARYRAEASREALDRLRRAAELDPDQLARALELQGCLQSALERDASARQAWTQALSLRPELESTCPIPWGRAQLDALRGSLAPERALAIGRILVAPVKGGGGVDVTVDVAPDPGRLARTVELQIQPDPDAPAVQRTLEIEHAGDRGRARALIETEGGPSPQVPVRVRVTDRFGATLAAEGDPDPLYVPLPRESRKVRIPGWVWWVAGGLAVAGGATAAILVATDDRGPSEPQRRLGPIDIRF